MSLTQKEDVLGQVREFWSDLFMEELREKHLLGALVNKEYDGEIKKTGDKVHVSQIQAPKSAIRTVGVDADSFDSNKLVTQKVEVVADKRAVSAFKFSDLVDLQSQIQLGDSAIREALLFDVMGQINDLLYGLVAPLDETSPKVITRDITGVTDFNASQVANLRNVAANSKWMKNKPWYLLADPDYYTDLLNASTLTNFDSVDEKPTVGGNIGTRRFGFNIFEDDSRPTDFAIAFHPDFLLLVMQQAARFKLSDLHSNEEFGFVLSVDIILGAKLGIDGDKKHARVINS